MLKITLNEKKIAQTINSLYSWLGQGGKLTAKLIICAHVCWIERCIKYLKQVKKQTFCKRMFDASKNVDLHGKYNSVSKYLSDNTPKNV